MPRGLTLSEGHFCLDLLAVLVERYFLATGAMERIEEIPQIIRIDAAKAVEDLLPSKSKESYLKEYETFKEWRKEKKITDVCEDVMLAYFNEKSEKYKSSSLWAQYSMLKATMNIYENVDMSRYVRLIAFLKDKHVGYEAKKSKVLTRQQIVEFLNSAPDDIFLMEKVAVVFGVSGACRCDELYSINVDYVQDKGNLLVVTIPRTNTNKRRVFTIMADDEMNGVDLYRKYLALRPKKVEHPSLFVSMRRGKCTVQRVGINSFYKIAKTVATYLKLEEPETYTGHSLRRSSATLLAESGTEIIPHKRHGSWRTGNAAEGYVEDSFEHRSAFARQYMGGDVQAGYDSSGDTFLMNQMADQNTSSGSDLPSGLPPAGVARDQRAPARPYQLRSSTAAATAAAAAATATAAPAAASATAGRVLTDSQVDPLASPADQLQTQLPAQAAPYRHHHHRLQQVQGPLSSCLPMHTVQNHFPRGNEQRIQHQGPGAAKLRPLLPAPAFTEEIRGEMQALELPYKCQHCDMSFTEMGQLQLHRRAHTRERPFRCDSCDSSFTQKHSLVTHKRIHSVDSRYRCSACSKTFGRSGDLLIHRRLVCRAALGLSKCSA
ncbi:Zinc finger protein 1 [Gryllus bimaculatus]|nr:Zinc finger protein 1 [Gryllus bimaculatus]